MSAINIYYMTDTGWELGFIDEYGRKLLLDLLGRYMNKRYIVQNDSVCYGL